MNHSELIARPCPFCGKAADLKNDDTLYPSGIWWRECDGLRSYHGHKDRCEDDFQCWGMHCQETAGGCGASVSGDSATDALEKWNKRPDALQAMEFALDATATPKSLTTKREKVILLTGAQNENSLLRAQLATQSLRLEDANGLLRYVADQRDAALGKLQALERVPMTTADMVNVVKAAGWPADTNDRQLVAAFNLIEATEAHHNITPPESI